MLWDTNYRDPVTFILYIRTSLTLTAPIVKILVPEFNVRKLGMANPVIESTAEKVKGPQLL